MGTTTSTLSPDSETRENGELFAALQNELSAHIEYLAQQQSYDLLKTQDFLAKSIASNGKFADDAWVFVENYSSEILKQQTEEKEASKRKTKNTTTADFLRSFQLQNNVLDRNDGDDGDRNFNDDDDEEEDYNSDEEEEEELDLHNFPKLKDFEIIEEHIKNTECDEDYDLTEEFARLQNIRISSMNRSNNDPHHHHDDHNHHNDNDTHPDHGDNEDNNHSNSHHTDDWIVVEDDPFKMALRKIEEFKAQKLAKQQQPPLPPPQNSSTAPSSVLPAMIINSYSPSPITSPRENIVDDADINSGAVRDDKNDGNDQLHSPPPPPLIISSSSASRSSSLSSDKETIKQLQEQITMLVIKIEQIEKRNNNFTHALLHRLGFDLSSSLSPPQQLVNNTTTTNNDNADNEDDKNEDEEKEGDIENVHKSNYHEVHVHSIVNNIESLINNNQITVNNNLHQIPINKPEPTTQHHHHHLMPPLLPSPSSSPPCSSPPPPPPPPSLEQLNQPFKKRTHHHQSKNKSKEEIQNLLTIEIEQSEISDKNKKIALNNYLKCFSSPSAFQFLDFMVTYYSPLIRALPLQPKTAFELIKVWESHLFTQIEDINQRNSLRKRKMTEICLKREHDEVIEEIEKIKKFIKLQKIEDEEKKRRDNLKKHFMNDLIEKLNQLNQLRADNNEDSKLELEQLEECVIDEHEIIPFTPDA